MPQREFCTKNTGILDDKELICLISLRTVGCLLEWTFIWHLKTVDFSHFLHVNDTLEGSVHNKKEQEC